jgi:hypothetical protein
MTVQPHALPQHEPTLEAKRILMTDFTSTQAQVKEVSPPASREGGKEEAAAATLLITSLPLIADGVDKMYHQLVEIHAITTS